MTTPRPPEKPSEVILPVTPMLDMAFQLMFFFIATFNPASAREGQMVLRLPSTQTSSAREAPADGVEPHKEAVNLAAEFTITVRGYSDEANRGQICALTVTTIAGEEEIRGRGVDVEAQRADRNRQLRERLTSDREGQPVVRIAADSGVLWGNVVQILDVCQDARLQVSFARPADFAVEP